MHSGNELRDFLRDSFRVPKTMGTRSERLRYLTSSCWLLRTPWWRERVPIVRRRVCSRVANMVEQLRVWTERQIQHPFLSLLRWNDYFKNLQICRLKIPKWHRARSSLWLLNKTIWHKGVNKKPQECANQFQSVYAECLHMVTSHETNDVECLNIST